MEMNAMELMQEVGLRHSLAQPSTQSCFLEIKDIVTLDTDNEFYRRLVLYGSVDHHDLAGERLKVARTYCGNSCRGELERIRRRLDGWLIWRFEWESELAGLLMHDRLLYRREREESIDAHLLVDGFLVFVASRSVPESPIFRSNPFHEYQCSSRPVGGSYNETSAYTSTDLRFDFLPSSHEIGRAGSSVVTDLRNGDLFTYIYEWKHLGRGFTPKEIKASQVHKEDMDPDLEILLQEKYRCGYANHRDYLRSLDNYLTRRRENDSLHRLVFEVQRRRESAYFRQLLRHAERLLAMEYKDTLLVLALAWILQARKSGIRWLDYKEALDSIIFTDGEHSVLKIGHGNEQISYYAGSSYSFPLTTAAGSTHPIPSVPDTIMPETDSSNPQHVPSTTLAW